MPKHASPPSSRSRSANSTATVEIYSATARALHWLVVVLLLVQIPLGLYMVSYGAATKFAPPTGQMYDSHKLLGLAILAVMAVRLAYRLMHGAPADEPTIEPWQKVVSHLTHWALYLMLLAIPFGGWLAVSYYGPVQPFGIKLPSLAAENKAMAETMFQLHKLSAFALMGLAGMHIAAALYHHTARGDNVLARMLPGLLRKK